MNDFDVMLAAIGDLELSRRKLVMQIAALQARVKELEDQLAESSED